MRNHPIFARFWDRMVSLGGREEQANRRELLEGLSGRVLEIGAGTGLNFAIYPAGVEVVALEPEPNMLARAVAKARTAPVRVAVVRGSAHELPFPEDAFDAAVACLVLCTIPDAALAAAELRRVIRPGGELRLYEHVRSPSPRAARWQDRSTPLWRRVGAGCHPNRGTATTLRDAGFDLEVRELRVGPPSPVRPHLLGVARAR